MHSLLIVGLVLLVRVIKVMELPVKHYVQWGRFKDSKLCMYSANYRKVASSNTSCFEALAGFFRLLMKGIFDPYVL